MIIIYTLLSMANLAALRLSERTDFSSFVLSRAIMGLGLSLLGYGLSEKRLFFSIRSTMFQRIVYGGAGMSLQVSAASQMPISLFAILNRSSALWFGLLQGQTSIFRSLSLLVIIFSVALIATFKMSLPLASVLTMAIATLLIANSQRSQVESAKKESLWLMPFAPSLGLFVIGVVLAIKNNSVAIDFFGLVSGAAMTLAYWTSHLLLSKTQTKGMALIHCDLFAATLLSGVDLYLRSNPDAFMLFVGTLIILVFSVRKRKFIQPQARAI